LQTINTNSQEKIYLEVYSNGVLSQADSLPTLSIYNADSDVYNPGGVISQTPLYTNLNAYDEPATGVYSYQLTPNLTSVNMVLEVVWSYTQNGVSVKTTDYYSIETPYASIPETMDFLGYSGTVGAANYLDPNTIIKTEKMARTIIEGYTGIKFYKYYGFQEIYGIGANTIQLTEKMLSLDQIWENQILVFDGTTSPVSSMLLQQDIMSNDYNWRNKYLSQVNLSEISFKMASGAFNGTGNVMVDNILDQYRKANIVII